MRIHNLYEDDQGISHWRDVEVEWADIKDDGRRESAPQSASSIIFRYVPPTYDLDWHPAPRRQYIINLDAVLPLRRAMVSAERLAQAKLFWWRT